MKKIITPFCVLLLLVNVCIAQEKKVKTEKSPINKTIEFKLKNVNYVPDSIEKPKIYVDGKLFNFDISLIDQDQIESLFVVKGEKAKTEYNAPQGVILIKTKRQALLDSTAVKIDDQANKIGKNEDPLFIIDGKVVEDSKKIQELSPNDIESIKVLKDNEAKKFYNAENGVIIIKTKKE